MFSILRSIWFTFLHAFHKRETEGYPEKSLIFRLATVEESFYPVILMAKKDALHVTCVLQPVRSTALPFRRRMTAMEDDIRNFSELIFRDAFIVVFVKRPVRLMQSS